MKTKPYIFWIRSSRGTDSQQVVNIDVSLREEGIREELEDWCSGFGAWEASENYISYGWTSANDTNMKKLNRYKDMKLKARTIGNKLIENVITRKEYDTWYKKNKKRMAFPFK